ncbi:SusC/RagA family TonB-linked outer membrane protein [Chitinophagaceae bacterium 26-R-25]|nr:SusC/RagA family TonB-linked outer membrane protein [Chitinophagaceae bacterium 26-R-25]
MRFFGAGRSVWRNVMWLWLLVTVAAALQTIPLASLASAHKRSNQEIKVTLHVKQGSFSDVFSEIRKQTGLVFFYSNEVFNDKEKVDANFNNTALDKVLEALLNGKSLSYKIANNYIVISKAISKKAESLLKSAASYNAPDSVPAVKLRGKVTGQEDGAILGQVSVENLDTKRGVFTNTQGEFAIDVRNGDSIRFSYVGKAARTIVFKGQSFLAVTLSNEGDKALSEVIVTGFQNIDKKKFSGASVRLKADEIKTDGVTDVSRMLEGRAAGVSVQNVSGTFGSAPKVRVRGATSIMGDNKPLWVVDGVVLEDLVNISNDQLSSGDPATLLGSAVAGLNANDIESFDILKDAAATALYGARAMNGVIVITTKKGKVGKPVVSYTGNFTTQLKPNYSNYNIMNSAEQMSVYGELERKGFMNSSILDGSDYGVYGKMYQLMDSMDVSGNFLLKNTPQARNAFLKRYATANTDWFDLMFRNNLMQEHSLSISSGTDKSQTYFSTSFYSDNGWTIADNVKRYTLNFRNNYKLSDKISTGFSTLASVRQQRAPGSLSRQSNAVEGKYDRDFDINPFSYALNTSRAMTAYDSTGNLEYFTRNFAPFNILNEVKNNYIDINVLDIRLQGDLTYKINRNFKYEFVGALRYVKSTQEHNITENSNMANAYRAANTATIRQANKFLYRDPDNPEAEPIVVLPYGGFYNRTENDLINYDIRNSITFNKTFAEKHNVNLLVGNQIKSADRQDFANTGYGYQFNNGGIPFIDYKILKQNIESNFPYYDMSKSYDRFVAFYANAQYTYNNKYNIFGTARYDGSNRLGETSAARWLPTWSAGGSWNIESEDFMQDFDWLDYLKLRGSYGLTASMGPATSASVIYKNQITNRPYSDETENSISLQSLKNMDLTWEKNYTGNIGLDGGFLKNRVFFSLDVYQRKSFDLISIMKTSGIGGEAYKYANYGDLESHGVEAMVGGEIIKGKDWKWKANFTFGYNTTKITNAKNEPTIFDLVKAEGGNKEGYAVSSLFSIDFTKLVHDNGVPLFINETGQESPAVWLQDQNTKYLVYNGPVDPKYTGGFNNTFTYKSFALNVFLTYQFGNKIRLYPAFQSAYSDLSATPKELNDRWVLPGDEAKTNVMSIMDMWTQYILSGAYPANNYNYSTARVAKGDLIRLKSVSLIYNLAPQTLRKIGLGSASFSLTGNNLWLIYSDKKLKGQDPEFFNAGGVAQPIQKQITLSLKVGI